MYSRLFKAIYAAAMLAAVACAAGCGGNTRNRPPYELPGHDNGTGEALTVPYEEYGGVKVIPVRLNGVTMNMIFDTGCSGVHMSLAEVEALWKNGRLTADDFLTPVESSIADGSVVANGRIRIRSIEIGDVNPIVLPETEATVSLNQEAPVLLGNGVLDELASVEVDNREKVIRFHRKRR